MNNPLTIDYYTDILCVWAWIAQRRIDELNTKLQNKIDIHYYYVDIFGDVPLKMENQWGPKGGYSGFAEHVRHCAATFEDAVINPRIWTEVRPVTSANAHLFLKAVEISYGKDKSVEIALALRSAFFVDAIDISNLEIISSLAEANGLSMGKINSNINNGSAIAALMTDCQRAKQQNVKGSPSYVIDGGRQTLYGNVGYRVLHANIDELLKQPQDEASWC